MKTPKFTQEDLEVAPFDAAEYLDSEEAIAAYIQAALEENDPALLMSALSDVIRARGVSTVAQKAGLGRASLYKTLAPGATPRLDTVMKLLGALDIRLSAAATHGDDDRALPA
ncbi:addiction module antidote protein [Herbaspirillum sp.]|uniref:addiction module antidote protein n=1 Tax=Herbaspirillum sp. TaxID=1890675 RepID=UPI0031D128F1